MKKKNEHQFTCSDCNTKNCYRQNKKFPAECLTTALNEQDLQKALDVYNSDQVMNQLMHKAAEIEGKYYGQLTRVEEILAFAEEMGVNKIGVAACVGLHYEAGVFTKIARKRNFTVTCVICKVGSVDKCDLGVADGLKIMPGEYEASCNPVLQAQILNRAETGLNVVMGLCVGHDSIFYKYSEAPATTLVTKDRVTGHNPAAALYTYHSYYNKISRGGDGN